MKNLLSALVSNEFIVSLGICSVVAIIATIIYRSRFVVLPQTTHALLPALPEIKRSDRILIISPHPDDETLGAGGLIQAALAKQAVVQIVLATDGNKRGLKNIRHQEIITAVSTLGLSEDQITFLDFPDGALAKQPAFFPKLQEIAQTFAPTIVLGTHPEDTHPDHAVVGKAALQLQQKLENHPTVYLSLIHYHRFPRPIGYKPETYLLPSGKLFTQNTWFTFSLTSEEKRKKEQALSAYKSQMTLKNPILKDLMLSFVRQNEIFAVVSQ